ncbi:TetR family transcriptional regulator [Streptomyces sp. NPDC006393]|uniref:TetR family transcriptional regulator n=1 Tax=Streptomyces sp. NPDC006393 TaxID=3156763 RepID=UPI0033FF6E02
MSTKPSPSLTERRKAATQLEIADAAAELFATRGPDGTTAEEIARHAGVALRTFYRYFRSKQDAVSPLLATGADRWRALLEATEPGTPLPRALEAAVEQALSAPDEKAAQALLRTRGLLRAATDDPALRAVWYRVNVEQALSAPDEKAAQALLRTRGLLRAATDDPALRAVWYRVNQESEERLVPVIARLAGAHADPLEVRLAAAAATDAIRIALETWADTEGGTEGPDSPAALAVRCLRRLIR